MINVGIIGCGRIAQTRHFPEYKNNENVNIAGIFDLNYQRSMELAEKYDTKAYKRLEDLLTNSEIDAVSVCTANYSHCEITISALKSGKSVLCEKPMGVTLDECKSMVDVANETGKLLMIGHNQRITKAHKIAKKLIKDGIIGQVLSFKTSFGHKGPETWTVDTSNIWFFDKYKTSLGVMADLGVHKTDLIQFLLDDTVVEVSAFLGTLDKRTSEGDFITVDDNSICIYKMSKGSIGTLSTSWTYYGSEDNSTILYGSEGIMYIYTDPKYSIIVEKKDGSKISIEADTIQTNDNQSNSGIIDLWIHGLLNDGDGIISGESAYQSMKTVFAAVQSSKERKVIKI